MSRMLVYLAPTPNGEPCAQVGEPGYGARIVVECRAYEDQLRRHATAAGIDLEAAGVALSTRAASHDYGEYYEVVASCDEHDDVACDAASWLEDNQPEWWDDQARAALGLVAP